MAVRFKRSEIAPFLAQAQRVSRKPGADILMVAAPRGIGRLLIITPRRIGTAPERNRARRRLKAIFHKKALAKLGYDCAVIVKIQGVNYSSQEWETILLHAFAKFQRTPQTNTSPAAD